MSEAFSEKFGFFFMSGLVFLCERSGSGDSSSFDDHLFIPPTPLLIIQFLPILGHFWCPVVPLVTLSSKLSNFEKNP